MTSIEVVNLTSRKVPEKDIILTVKKIITRLRREKKFSFLENVELSIAFIKEGEMKRINKKYRNINKPTDELSFLLSKTKAKLSGEILLCPAIIKSKNYDFHNPNYKLKTKNYKLRGLLAHAFLHLCGYDHETDKEWKKMEEMESVATRLTIDK